MRGLSRYEERIADVVTDVVELLPSTAEALQALDLGPIGRVNSPELMAWIVQVLRHVPDSEKVFPHGKWTTIQHIESQVAECAKARASAR